MAMSFERKFWTQEEGMRLDDDWISRFTTDFLDLCRTGTKI
jgi:hypothetical protein